MTPGERGERVGAWTGDEPEPLDLPIDGQLDLHTFRPQEVRDLLHEYLDACRERDILEVRVIHGKGTGAMRRIVHSELGRRADVVAYRLAPDASGWGATLVILAADRPPAGGPSPAAC